MFASVVLAFASAFLMLRVSRGMASPVVARGVPGLSAPGFVVVVAGGVLAGQSGVAGSRTSRAGLLSDDGEMAGTLPPFDPTPATDEGYGAARICLKRRRRR